MLKKAFVAGFPIHHSLSPHIHSFWLQQYGLQGEYVPCEVKGEDFSHFIHSLREKGFVGGNVTLPHKEQACQLVRASDEMARQVGAVNTLWFEGDVLWGANSDVEGFARNLDDFACGWEADTALVLGAGGAARAVIAATFKRGFKRVLLANRTRARAEMLADHFGEKIDIIGWDDINAHLAKAQLIINTTSIGIGEDKGTMPLDFSHADKDAIVSDIVYVPLETPFLRAAACQGLKTVDGLGMLLHQAVLGFEHWFDVTPQVDASLRQHILAQLTP